MYYPKLNGKTLSKDQKNAFDIIKDFAFESINSDNSLRKLELSYKDIDVVSHNIAANLISKGIELRD